MTQNYNMQNLTTSNFYNVQALSNKINVIIYFFSLYLSLLITCQL